MQERAQEYVMEQQIRGQISALNTQQVVVAQSAPVPTGLNQQPYPYSLSRGELWDLGDKTVVA